MTKYEMAHKKWYNTMTLCHALVLLVMAVIFAIQVRHSHAHAAVLLYSVGTVMCSAFLTAEALGVFYGIESNQTVVAVAHLIKLLIFALFCGIVNVHFDEEILKQANEPLVFACAGVFLLIMIIYAGGLFYLDYQNKKEEAEMAKTAEMANQPVTE